jgi:hypothetical protein
MYEKFSIFFRLEVLSNNLRDFGLGKALDNLEQVRQTLAAVTDRFAAFEAEALNVPIDFPCFNGSPYPSPRVRPGSPASKSRTPRSSG